MEALAESCCVVGGIHRLLCLHIGLQCQVSEHCLRCSNAELQGQLRSLETEAKTRDASQQGVESAIIVTFWISSTLKP